MRGIRGYLNRKKSAAIISIVLTVSVFCFLGTPACGEKLQVAVSIVPQKYFLEKIGGKHINVMVIVPPGGNPATYEPKPQQMARMSRCKVYFGIGVPFEQVWLPRFSKATEGINIVRTDNGIQKVPMKPAKHALRIKRNEHGTNDPHIWLSPPLVMIQARNILEGLLRAYPEKRKVFEANYRSFIQEIVDVDLKIRSIFSCPCKPNRFLVFHPAWGYFARTYGLEQVSLEMEGKKPFAKQMGDFNRFARKQGFDTLFVQPQFPSKIPQTIAKSINGKLVIIDPLAYDWANNLISVARKIKPALR